MSNDQVPRVTATSWASLEKITEQVRRKVIPDFYDRVQALNLAEFFEFDLKKLYGYEYQITNLPTGVEAITLCKSKTIILSEETYEGLHDGDGRARFTVAHELGHVIVHAPYLSESTSTRQNSVGVRLNRSSLAPYEDPEVQANAFAARLLMPTQQVRYLISEGHNANEIAKIFGVSFEAASYRMKSLLKK